MRIRGNQGRAWWLKPRYPPEICCGCCFWCREKILLFYNVRLVLVYNGSRKNHPSRLSSSPRQTRIYPGWSGFQRLWSLLLLFLCSQDRFFGEHFGLFPTALEARSFASQISNLSSLKADTAHLVISYEGPDELNGFEWRRYRWAKDDLHFLYFNPLLKKIETLSILYCSFLGTPVPPVK